MSNITDWIKEELYPSLLDRIDTVFPEHDFKQFRGGWRSAKRLFGEDYKGRNDKTVITNKAPGYIFEQGGERLSIIDYVMRRNGLEFMGAVRLLADKAGLHVPESKTFDPAAYQRRKSQEALLEDANSYFMESLRETSKTPGAEYVMAYLATRAYTSTDIALMELGFIPSQEALYKHLKSKGYTQDLIEEAITLNSAIGSTHTLTIPYRSGGVIKGFIFRTTGPEEPKYLNSTGLERSKTFFNLKPIKGDKDLTIVEGWLDALIADARGIDNVVGLGGTNINTEQIKHAIRHGAKRFTLCLDNDGAGRKATLKAIDTLLEEDIEPFVMILPDGAGKTDPDSIIRERGGEEVFKKAAKEALSYWAYWLRTTGEKYEAIQTAQDSPLTDKQIKDFEEEVQTYGARIKSPVDKDQFIERLLSHEGIQALGITRESLSIAIDRLRSTKEKEERGKTLRKILTKATDLQTSGDTEGALELLEKQGKQLLQKAHTTTVEALLEIPTEESIRRIIQEEPDSLPTGYSLTDGVGAQDLELPSGALSIIAARTSHRKTSLMMNMALNIARKISTGEVYFFTYEESREAILTKLLNIYIDKELKPGDNNLKYIKAYFKKDGKGFTNDDFIKGKDRFFKDLITPGRLRVNYSTLDIDQLTGAIQQIKERGKPVVIFIDYIQLLRINGKFNSRQLELQEICEKLRETAIATGLPLVLGAQFNRTVTMEGAIESGAIREAGDIEQTADLVLGLWDRRFTKPNDNTHKDRRGNAAIHDPGTLYVEILKGRSLGAGAYGELKYNGNTWKINNHVSRSGSGYFDE